MSLPSYQLFKNSLGVWICSGEMPTSGRPFRFEAGKGTRDTAKAVAESTLQRRMQSAEGSRQRWVKWKAARANGEQRTAPAKTSTPTAAPAAPPRQTAEQLRAKLLGLGDSQPLDADAVLPPTDEGATGAAADDGDQQEEEQEELDDEGAELIASLFAKGATLGLVGLVNRRLKKRKPPMQAEPHEKGLEWFHDGLEHHFKKLLGKTATLGPTGKIFAGAAIIVGSMYMSAEPIDGAASSSAESPPGPPPVHESGTTNGTPSPVEQSTQLARVGIPVGVFGVEKTTAN